MPNMQDVTINGPWTRAEVRSFLSEAIIPIRLAVLSADAWPLVLSLWFMVDEDALWCATNQRALIVRHLGENDRCGFEVAGDIPPYRGIRGQGRAIIDHNRGVPVLKDLLSRYSIQPESRLSRMLLANAHEETAIRIEPDWLTSWDFTDRMKDAMADIQVDPND